MEHVCFGQMAVLLWVLKIKHGFRLKRCKTVQKEECELILGGRVNTPKYTLVSHRTDKAMQVKFFPETFLFGYLYKGTVRTPSTVFYSSPIDPTLYLFHFACYRHERDSKR